MSGLLGVECGAILYDKGKPVARCIETRGTAHDHDNARSRPLTADKGVSAVVSLPTKDGRAVSARVDLVTNPDDPTNKIFVTLSVQYPGSDEWIELPDARRRLLHSMRPDGPGLHMLFAMGWVTLQEVVVVPDGAVHLAYAEDERFEHAMTLCGRVHIRRLPLQHGATLYKGQTCSQCIAVAKVHEL